MTLAELCTPERLARGRIIVLPGIEGHSRWNRSIVRGLLDAGIDCGIEIHDWTYGRWWSLYSLHATDRHQAQADLISQSIIEYRTAYPGPPVWLIGHSGGGAMSILTLERLTDQSQADGAILLGPALSPQYDLAPALARTRRGIWNFSSWGDVIFLIAGTLLFGTIDRRRTISAGACGFRKLVQCPPASSIVDAAAGATCTAQAAAAAAGPQLYEVPWNREMLQHGNFAGHFGYVHRRFVRHWIAPIIQPGAAAPLHPQELTSARQATAAAGDRHPEI